MMKKGKLIVISGPSGVGKGSICSQLLNMDSNYYFSISATTRSPRTNEQDGKDYFFISKKEFESKIGQGEMLEYAQYCSNYYGTPLDITQQKRGEGHDVILEIEVQGALSAKKKCPDAVMIFVLPPSLNELKNRLVGRKTENEKVIRKRLETAISEIESAKHYEYLVINESINAAVAEVNEIICGNTEQTANKQRLINTILKC